MKFGAIVISIENEKGETHAEHRIEYHKELPEKPRIIILIEKSKDNYDILEDAILKPTS